MGAKELNRYQKEYIENYLNAKSERRIARDLGCDRATVSSYIKILRSGRTEEKTAPSSGAGHPKIPAKVMTVIHVAAIFFIALIIRLIYIKQLSNSYFFAPFSGGYDDHIFDNWALEILKGNWLGDRLIYIYRMPLYVYFLSLIYYVFGHAYMAVYLIQSALGALTCVIVYATGRMLFSRRTGLLAGLITALYGPIIFYTGMIVGEVLGMAITCLAFLSLLCFQRTGRSRHLLISGILIGLSMLVRGNMLIVLPFIFAWVFLAFRNGSLLKPVKYIAALCLGVIIAVSPIVVRNYVAEKDFVPITALGGFNIYIGNAYGADGKYRLIKGVGTNPEEMIRNSIRIAEERTGKKMRPSEISDFWIKETLSSIKEHGPGYFIFLAMKKFAMFWNAYELPDIWDYYFFKQFIPLLRAPLFGFFFVVPLSIVGAYLGWARRKEISLLYIFVAGYMFSLVSIFITSRYRIQALPFLSIFAAYALSEAPALFANNRKRFTACALIFLFSLIFTLIPVTEKISFETSYNSLGIILKKQGRFEDAIRMYTKASQIAPGYPSPYYNMALLYRDIGRVDLAVQFLNKAVQADPNFTPAIDELQRLR